MPGEQFRLGYIGSSGSLDPRISDVQWAACARVLAGLTVRHGASPAALAEVLLAVGFGESDAPGEKLSDRLRAISDAGPVWSISTAPKSPSAGNWEPRIELCRRGLHPMSGKNLYRKPNGSRECKACRNATRRATSARKRQEKTRCASS